MKHIAMILAIFVLECAIHSCSSAAVIASEDPILRQAENVPELFLPEKGKELDTKSCKNPMIDPRDNTEILLVSSTAGMGNYQVPEGKYGVKKGELLRLDCTNGKALGIVRE